MEIIKQILGRQIQLGGGEFGDFLPSDAAPPPADVNDLVLDLRIIEAEGGFILAWQSRETDHANDTWHETLEDALNQAVKQFGVKADEWTKPDESEEVGWDI